jgi:Phytanoyl-CoA dioxygenase (PhyH)
MVSFDVRTRTAADVRPVDPVTFHRDEVPALLEANGGLAGRAFRASGLDSIVIAVGGEPFTWGLDGDGTLTVRPGDGGRARADLPGGWFEDIVNDVRSTVALMIAGDSVMSRGSIVHLIAWEPVLRALVDGRPAYEPGLVDFADRDGAPLDLDRSFSLDDDAGDIRRFLGQAGFLHLRGVFDGDEVARLGAEIDRWRDRMSEDDTRAWYAEAAGRRVCVRVSDLRDGDVDVPLTERLAPVATLTGDGHRFKGTDLLVKPVGVTAGISDLPWHKDCALGMHSYRCRSVICGVSVTPSGRGNGALGVVAGSHRVNIPLFDLGHDVDLPVRYLATEPGDVTVHLSCTLHCSTPPQVSERRVSYTTFELPGDVAELDRTLRAVRDQAGRDTYAPG